MAIAPLLDKVSAEVLYSGVTLTAARWSQETPMKVAAGQSRSAKARAPIPTIYWQLRVVLDWKLHSRDRGRHHVYRGMNLDFDGPPDWSQVHYQYTVRPPGSLRREFRLDPIGLLVAVARA